MNIGIITAYHEPIGFNHGVLQFCKLLQASTEYGINPVIIAMTRHPSKENPLVLEARRLGLHVETLHEEFRYDPRVFSGLLKLADRLDLRLLDAQTYKPLALGLFAHGLRQHVSLVSWVHGFTQENLKVRIFGKLETYMHRFSDRVICVSKPFAEIMEKNGIDRNKMEIIPNAIGDEEFEHVTRPDELREEMGIDKESRIVGAIGRLSPEKGHSFLIKAWEKIQRPNVKLLIVGAGPCMKALQQQVKDLELQDSVVFTGFRPDGRRFFSIFDVMVLPSLAEGLPYVLLEAMIQKVPVVASAVGEVPEVLENGRIGRLVKAGDIDAIAQNVINLLDNPQDGDCLAFEARTSVLTRYSHITRTGRIIDVYRQVLASKNNI